jgi:hypothetical protein
VKASLDPVRNSLVIETTVTHQLMIEDVGDGTRLKRPGIVSGNGRPPAELAQDARVSGGSLFDMVISSGICSTRVIPSTLVVLGSRALPWHRIISYPRLRRSVPGIPECRK